MGHVTHRVVIAFAQAHAADKYRPVIEDFRRSLLVEDQRLLIGPVGGTVNHIDQYVFLSSGSKDGWLDHDVLDRQQDEFVSLLEQFRHDDGSSPITVITVQVGEGEYEPLLYDSPKTYLSKEGVPYVPQYKESL